MTAPASVCAVLERFLDGAEGTIRRHSSGWMRVSPAALQRAQEEANALRTAIRLVIENEGVCVCGHHADFHDKQRNGTVPCHFRAVDCPCQDFKFPEV